MFEPDKASSEVVLVWTTFPMLLPKLPLIVTVPVPVPLLVNEPEVLTRPLRVIAPTLPDVVIRLAAPERVPLKVKPEAMLVFRSVNPVPFRLTAPLNVSAPF